MLSPLGVDRLEKKLLLDIPDRVRTEGRRLVGHGPVRSLDQSLADDVGIHALLGGPVPDRHVDPQLFACILRQRIDIPLVRIAARRHRRIHKIGDQLMAHVPDDLLHVRRLHDLTALAKDHLALFVHHVVELEELLADVEIAPLDLRLRTLEALVHPRMHDGLAFFHPELAQDAVEPFGPEDAHQIIFQREVEGRPPRVALPARASAQLVVDPPALVAFGGKHEEPACGLDPRFLVGVSGLYARTHLVGMGLGVCGQSLEHLHLDIAAKLDVGPPPRHIRRDRHSAKLARIRHDLRLLRMLARIQHIVRDALLRQQPGQELRFLDRGRTNENRLPALMRLADRLGDGVVLLARGAIDLVMFVNPHDRAVRRHLDYSEAVDLAEFLRLGGGGPSHPGKLVVEPEVILECHRRERHVLGLDLDALLGLDGLVQPVRQSPPDHHTAGELVDQHHLVVPDDIVLVLLEEFMRPQSLIDVMHDRGAFGVIEILPLGQDTCLA